MPSIASTTLMTQKRYHHFAVRPAQSLEVMMDEGLSEDFSPQIFLENICKTEEPGGKKRKSDNRQDRHSIGQKRHHRQGGC